MGRQPGSRSAASAKPPTAAARRERASRASAKQAPLFAIDCLEIEDGVRGSGYSRIAGIDEVGRGCWAGPVYAAAVILPPACFEDRQLLAEVTDSKLLTPLKRERLAQDVLNLAMSAAIGWADPPVIDRLNILGATRLAMRAAVECLDRSPSPTEPGWGARRLTAGSAAPDYLLIDAVPLSEIDLPQRPVIRGDRCCLSIAAASIIAKVIRDDEMRRNAERFPGFSFEENKGYGTRRHLGALRQQGVTPLHRRSFAPMKYLLGLRDHIVRALPAPAQT